MIKTFKYRLYPNKDKVALLWKHANKLNWLYNQFLDQRITEYKTNKKSISKFDQFKQLPTLKSTNATLAEIHSQVLREAPNRLNKSFQDFFKRIKRGKKPGFPRFRSCEKFFGICYPQPQYQKKLVKGIWKTKQYGEIRFNLHRPFIGKVKQIFVTTENNRWYISVITESDDCKPKNKSIIGVDLGITNTYALSNGEICKNPGHAKYFDKLVGVIQSRRSKCTRRSRKYKKLSSKIRQLYEMKKRKVNDHLHKASRHLADNYGTIVVEDLKSKKMSESKISGLNRENRNAKYAAILNMLEYKANRIIKVPPYFTSKICNHCGNIHDMPLSQRTMKCDCGHIEDRDVNAAKNILCLGQARISGKPLSKSTLLKSVGSCLL